MPCRIDLSRIFQANAVGDLSERAKLRAAEWALDAAGKCNGRGGREFPALQVPLAFGHNAINPGRLGAQPPRPSKRHLDHLGKIGFGCISAHAEGFLKAVGRKPSGEGSSVVFHARTLRKPLDI